MGKKFDSIQNKLTRTFCTVILCALFVSNVFTYSYQYHIYSKELVDNYREIGGNISEQLERDLSSIENFARIVCFDTNLQRLMQSHLHQAGYPYYRTIREIITSLAQYVTLRDDLIDDIYIVDREENIISRNGFYADTLDSGWFQAFERAGANFAFSEVHGVERRDSNLPSNRQQVVSCIVSMFDLGVPTQPAGFMGYVIINIKYDALMNTARSFTDLNCTLIKENGEAVDKAAHERQPLPRKDREGDYYSDGLYYFHYRIPLPQWTLVTSVEASSIRLQLLRSVLMLLCITLVIMAISGRVVAALAKNITDPLKPLMAGVHRLMHGDFETRVEIHSRDEIEEIAIVFNDMVDNIKGQMEENRRKEAAKRKSEMRFLMAQIKPHFIYNSLNCIIYLARRHQDADIIQFTRAFISLLQVSIRTQPQQQIPLANEIENLKNYVTLIRYRYENATDFTCQVEECCCDVQLPGLILLPLVENSVFHGILPGKIAGHIVLSVGREGEGVMIKLRDNGCGIPPGKLKELITMLAAPNPPAAAEEHIGLFNVNERLKLCYGANGALHIDSQEGVGTQVWFFL